MKESFWSAKRVLKLLGNIVFYAIIILLMVFSVANMKVKREDNLANIFGVGLLSVQSDSMKGVFETGDLLLVDMLNEDDYNQLKIGDIVTYFDNELHAFNTHRIVDIDYDLRYAITQAEYNYHHPDEPTTPDQPVNFDRIIAIYDGSMIAGLGSSLDYLQTSVGFALFVILPVLVVMIFEGVLLAKHFMALSKEKLEEKYAQERDLAVQTAESERERIRAEILAEMKKDQALSSN